MNTFLRNAISKLCNAVSDPVEATQDALVERLQIIRETASLLYKRMMKDMGHGQERLKDIMEKESEEEEHQQEEDEETKEQQQGPASAKEQQQNDDDDERYDTAARIRLVYEGKRVKEFRGCGPLPD